MTRVRFEKAILEARSDVEIAPGVVLPAGWHNAVRRQSGIPGQARPRYLLEINQTSYDVTGHVLQQRLRPTV
jgi:hypothetical protein